MTQLEQTPNMEATIVETEEGEQLPDQIEPDDIEILSFLQQPGKEKLSEEKKAYLRELLGTPGKWLRTDHPLYKFMDGLLSATFAHYIFTSKVVVKNINSSIRKLFRKEEEPAYDFTTLEDFLESQLQFYDRTFMDKIEKEMAENPLTGIDIKLMYKQMSLKEFVHIYTKFWGTWNPAYRHPNRMVYESLGGKDSPFVAPITTMGYNGIMHIMHPVALPLFIGYAKYMDQPVSELLTTKSLQAAGFFIVLAIPISIGKYLKKRNKDSQNDSSIPANPEP